MKTINIKGKDYITVNERLKYFRTSIAPIKESENWGINEEVIDLNEKEGVFKVTIHDAKGNPVVSAHAQEYRDSTYINKTSFVENGFTSALGRALGYLGIGIDTSIASGEEMQNAIQNQKPRLTEEQLKGLLKSDVNTIKQAIEKYNVDSKQLEILRNNFKN